MKLLRVCEIGDPYEHAGTMAICTSQESAVELFDPLWMEIGRTPDVTVPDKCYGPGGRVETYGVYTYTELHSGRIKKVSRNSLDHPSPYIEEVESDILL